MLIKLCIQMNKIENVSEILKQDGRLVPGAGAVEVELAKHITQYSETCPGLDQYAIQKFAQVIL